MRNWPSVATKRRREFAFHANIQGKQEIRRLLGVHYQETMAEPRRRVTLPRHPVEGTVDSGGTSRESPPEKRHFTSLRSASHWRHIGPHVTVHTRKHNNANRL